MIESKIAGWLTNSVDPDQMPLSAVSDQNYIVCCGLYVWKLMVNQYILHLYD